MKKTIETTTSWTEGALTLTVQTSREASKFHIAATGGVGGGGRATSQCISLSPVEARELRKMLDEALAPEVLPAPSDERVGA